MSAFSGIQKPTNKIVAVGDPLVADRKVGGTVTNMKPGRLVKRGSTDFDIAIGTAFDVCGWLGYEQAHPSYRPTDVDTAYAADDMAPVLYGGKFVIVGSLVKGCVVTQGEYLANWTNGQVIGPIAMMEGGLALGIPFEKATSEQTTYIELPADMVVKDVIVDVSTNVASSHIDIGILSTESGGDADGFLDGESCAAAGKVEHNMVDATAANNTLGALLVESDIKSADGTALFYSVPKQPGHVCDGTAKTITYTTSDHAIEGTFWVVLEAEGFNIVGKAVESVDASSAAQDIMLLSSI
ncbi:hypothetical protein DRN97_03005 [Methanosarcinales archaeon]|nr:MAG: hypothetical protein DRN97_03005 [Methanosarcinales archaeon]